MAATRPGRGRLCCWCVGTLQGETGQDSQWQEEARNNGNYYKDYDGGCGVGEKW